MLVHKFGGTSLGNAERFARVIDIILTQQTSLSQPSQSTVVVVSAMSGVTDALIAGARAAADGRDSLYRAIKADLLQKHLEVVEPLVRGPAERRELCGMIEDKLHELERLYRSIAVLGELTGRGCDAVASYGELLSASILAVALGERGARSKAVSATVLIVTDEHFGAAVPLQGPTEDQVRQQILPLLQRGVIPIITGYVAATAKGVTTTLGRSGSDFSAALIGAALKADEVCIWSDVNGILTADPNIVPQARTLDQLSYAEAAELAYFGAEVLHPRTVRPLADRGIPLRIRNSFDASQAGTLICATPSNSRQALPAIISGTGFSLIAAGSQNDGWGLDQASQLLQKLGVAGVDVRMFWQSLSEHSINLMVRAQDQAHCLQVLGEELQHLPAPESYQLGTKEEVATISVVGVPGWGRPDSGIVSQAFAVLGRHSTRIIAVAQPASEYSVSFCIPEAQMVDTVRFLHRELGLEA